MWNDRLLYKNIVTRRVMLIDHCPTRMAIKVGDSRVGWKWCM